MRPPVQGRPDMEEKVRRTPAKLSDLVEAFNLEILLQGDDGAVHEQDFDPEANYGV